jgi:uncharacterized protein
MVPYRQTPGGSAGIPRAVGPIAPGERLPVIDVLRGVAILGILIVNMDAYAWPLALPRLGWADSAGWADRLAGAFIRLAAEGKFYPLFSLLFGFGLAVQMARAEARGVAFARLYERRLLALLGIGLAHALLVWYGDILVTYAILGFPLLALRHRRPGTLLVWAAACWLLPVALDGLVLAALRGSLPAGAGAVLERIAAVRAADDLSAAARSMQSYGRGSFAQIFQQRLDDVKALYLAGSVSIPTIFAMFVLGLWAGRRRIFDDLSASAPLFARVLIWGFVVGGAGNLAYVLAHDLPGGGLAADFVAGAAHALTAPVLTLGYVALVARLMTAPAWQRRLRPLEAVGRMALSNYLSQSVICTTIFYGYGLGLYGRIGLAEGVALAVVIYAAQVAWSTWWMRRFRYGPVEWLWRALTYGHRP